ncbi:MAG: GGDEF domain-containing protein [Kofleriaceae bacterium]
MSLIAGLRERRERGALVVELEGSRTRVQVLEDAALGMLDCVTALVLDLDEIGAPALRETLTALRGRLSGGDDSARVAEHLAGARAEALEFAEAERDHLARRDAELHRIIQVLTDGLTGITRGAAAYHKQILDSGTRFEAATRLSDLQRVRAAITTEVQSLRTAVEHRQRTDSRVTDALRAEIETLRVKVEHATHAARVDALTGAANRGAFDDELARRCTLAASNGEPFALLLADIDHFKVINDTHGHPVGDRVLQSLVTFLRDRVRRDDTIARWGGEEFAVLLPKASARAAFAKAKALVGELETTDWTIDHAKKLRFTISIGVVGWQKDDAPTALIERADKALYAAKHGGRNRAVRG